MPEIFRFFEFSFFFYSREHEPPHIHVEGKDGMAKFEWNGERFVVCERHNVRASDFKKIHMAVDDNADLIIQRWKEYFG